MEILRPALASLGRTVRQRSADDSDLVLVHRLRSLMPVPGLEFSQRVDVYDFDDAMFLRGGVGTGGVSRLIKRESQRWGRYVERARLVLAGNQTLASAARGRARRVEIVPSCIDPARQLLRVHGDYSPVTVGWIGSPATGGFLHPLLEVFGRLNRDRLQVRLVCVGAGVLPPAPWLERRPWRLERERDDLREFDIGIMPLPDTPWARGKCGYKVLQYFSAGIPVIASPVGLNKELVGTDRGRLAITPEEWRDVLQELIDDPQARRQMGTAGRRLVERDYSYARWAPELAELLRSVPT